MSEFNIERFLQLSGAVNVLARHTLPQSAGTAVSLLALVGLGALLSGFMNNVGAMALLMPLAIQLARRLQIAPGQVLMPLAFGTILGGMTTLIGTPPNLIVSGFRAESGLGGFSMFDFTPVGLAVALAGVAFVATVGWRLVPVRKQSGLEGFETGAYLTEAREVADSGSIGKALYELDPVLDEAGAQVVGMSRDHMRVIAPYPGRRLREGPSCCRSWVSNSRNQCTPTAPRPTRRPKRSRWSRAGAEWRRGVRRRWWPSGPWRWSRRRPPMNRPRGLPATSF